MDIADDLEAEMNLFWRRWLIVAATITGVVGLVFAVLNVVGAAEIGDRLFDLVYVPGGLETRAGDVASFALGIAGAVMVGWAAMMLVLLTNPTSASSQTMWRALTVGIVSWFVVDGIVSIASGAFGNVALNVAFIAMYAPPLIATRPTVG